MSAQTGAQLPPKVKRTFILEPRVVDGAYEPPRELLNTTLGDLIGAGWAIGGIIRIVFDRIEIATLEGGEPLGQTVGAVVEYEARAPLHDSPMTIALLDRAKFPDVPDAGPIEPDDDGGESESED